MVEMLKEMIAPSCTWTWGPEKKNEVPFEMLYMDGREGKDLADVCRISADCLERERKFVEVLP